MITEIRTVLFKREALSNYEGGLLIRTDDAENNRYKETIVDGEGMVVKKPWDYNYTQQIGLSNLKIR